MREDHFWQQLLADFERSNEAVLCIVTNSSGSSPGKQGFKMAVFDDTIIGTIGGGIMEHEIINRCKLQIRNGPYIKFHRMVHNRRASPAVRSGLICSGEQQIVSIVLTMDDHATIQKIIDLYRIKDPSILRVTEESLRVEKIDPESDFPNDYEFQQDPTVEYRELVGVLDTAYVFGGGHVGSAVATQLALLDFYTILVDNRDDLIALPRTNDELVIHPYNEVGSLIKHLDKSYLVVVTSTMITDIEVLEQVIGLGAKYLGVMGSKTKIKRIKNALDTKNIDYSKVNAPIGLPINNETPAEIAVSIAGELINVKNR